MTTRIAFLFRLIRPKGLTRLRDVRLQNVPQGSKVTARCRTKAGKTCKGRFTRDQVGGTVRIKAIERRYPAGTRLVFTIANPAYVTQVKTLTIRKRRGPVIRNRSTPVG